MLQNYNKRNTLLGSLRAMMPGDELFVPASMAAHTTVRSAAARATRDKGRTVRINVHFNGSGCEVRCFER